MLPKRASVCCCLPAYFRRSKKPYFATQSGNIQCTSRMHFSELDLTVIKLPPGYSVETIPEPIEVKPKFGMYRNTTKASEDQIVNTRGMFISQFMFEPA